MRPGPHDEADAAPPRLRGEAPLGLIGGRYELLLPIASGGMATVYLAWRRDGGAPPLVALKRPHDFLRDIDSFRTELLEEARLALQIRHPNVVRVLDVDDGSDGPFLVMEYVEGDTLATLVHQSSEAGLPLGIGLRILLDALGGLHAAHELPDASGALAGVVHRDFSPQNILIGLDGVAKLADFGVAKAATRLSNTKTGAIKGKIAYMAPEQARGLPLDRRCDVWAAGVMAWELLAGQRLHGSDNDAATLLAVVTEEPPPLWSVRADVPRELADVVAHALTMDLPSRCPDVATLARGLIAGCASGGIRIAELDEVGAHLTALVGAKLAKRRARAAEIVAERDRARAPAPPGPVTQAYGAAGWSATAATPPAAPRAAGGTVLLERPAHGATKLGVGAPGDVAAWRGPGDVAAWRGPDDVAAGPAPNAAPAPAVVPVDRPLATDAGVARPLTAVLDAPPPDDVPAGAPPEAAAPDAAAPAGELAEAPETPEPPRRGSALVAAAAAVGVALALVMVIAFRAAAPSGAATAARPWVAANATARAAKLRRAPGAATAAPAATPAAPAATPAAPPATPAAPAAPDATAAPAAAPPAPEPAGPRPPAGATQPPRPPREPPRLAPSPYELPGGR